MATRPAGSPPTWATDTNYTNSPGEPWQTTPTKVEPSSGDKAQGGTPGRKLAAQWFNWIVGTISAWGAYFGTVIDANDEHTYPAAKTRTVYVSPVGGMSGLQNIDAGTGNATDITFGEEWRIDAAIVGSGPETLAENGIVRTSAEYLNYVRDIGQALRTGQGLTTVAFRVNPGQAEATAGERMTCTVAKRELATGTVTTLGTGTASSSAGAQVVSIGFASDTIDLNAYTYFVLVRSSLNAPAAADRFESIRLTYTDLGPRNYV